MSKDTDTDSAMAMPHCHTGKGAIRTSHGAQTEPGTTLSSVSGRNKEMPDGTGCFQRTQYPHGVHIHPFPLPTRSCTWGHPVFL